MREMGTVELLTAKAKLHSQAHRGGLLQVHEACRVFRETFVTLADGIRHVPGSSQRLSDVMLNSSTRGTGDAGIPAPTKHQAQDKTMRLNASGSDD